MSEFIVPVITINAIESIPDANAIEVAVVGDYRSVVSKGKFNPGDLAIYIPEGAVVPDNLLEKMNLVGKLAGHAKNRVKAIKLRGCLSQGILYNDYDFDNVPVGSDLAETLGITKYEPPIPSNMAGDLACIYGKPLHYDIENYKRFPDMIEDGELVEITEKTHGTFCGIAFHQGLNDPEMFRNSGFVYSKGLGAKGLVFKNNVANEQNLYVQIAKKLNLHERIEKVFPGQTVHVLGEIYGGKRSRFRIWLRKELCRF